MYPESLKILIDNLKNLPGIGSKTAERLAFCMIDFDKDKLTDFSNAISNVRDNINKCEICGSITDNKVCNVCLSNSREKNIILVVEKAKDIYLFEKLGIFNGVYHVLNGLISPLDGIGPQDITISKLLDRINNDNITEVILALKPSIEGETTMQYISQLLKSSNVIVTKIATGVPMGTDMEYIDSLTLEMAIDERKNMN
ncbi:MAG: recombination protein RecR [Bacilli bacterium]|nr:recombination protein RecR [Bacilli bacterium]